MSQSSKFTWAQYLAACKRTGQKPEYKSKPKPNPLLKEPSQLEALFDVTLQRLAPHLPAPIREFKPWPKLGNTCDRVWIEQRVIVEVEGFGHGLSRYEGDVRKYNRLAAEGWTLLRCTRKTLEFEADTFFALLVQTIERRSN